MDSQGERPGSQMKTIDFYRLLWIYSRGEEMKKRIIIGLLVVLLLLGETVFLFATEETTSPEEIEETFEPVDQLTDSSPTSCGEGNGGGDPG